jgi:hypothetical protein
MPMKEFREAAKHGCGMCTVQAEVLDDDQMTWTSPNSFLCNTCFQEEYSQFVQCSYKTH